MPQPAHDSHLAVDATEDVSAVLDEAERLLQSGEVRAAIELVAAANRVHLDGRLDEQLVRLRHHAPTAGPVASGPWPPQVPDRFDGTGIPEIQRADLNAEVLASALAHRGSLLVRGLLPRPVAADLLVDVRRAFEAAEAWGNGAPTSETSPYYVPFEPDDGSFGPIERGLARALGGDTSHGVLTVESPRSLFKVIEAFRAAGIGELLEEYLGEWPAISAKKSTLRRATVTSPTEWHQDGAFLGPATRTVNTWVALTPCGTHAPGIEVFPRPFDRIVETGTDNALFSWSVSPQQAEREGAATAESPQFGPGDALLFNQMTLHRTGITPTMTEERVAIESWFFAPSTYPWEQVPILF